MAAQPGWFRFLSTYYVANTVVLLSYFVARWHFLNHGPHGTYSRLDSRDDLISKERSTFPLLLLALAVKFWRQQSLDGFLSDLFFYGKACIGVLTFYQDVRAPAVLLLAWLLLFLLVPQPLYKGPSSIENFTPASFKDTVLDRPDSGTDWLVELFAPWAPPCIHLEPVLAKLSLAYTAEHLRFGRIDVSKWPAMAAQLNVNLSGVAQQLPTLLLFEKGKEAARIPHVYEDGSVAKGRFRKADIITGFELERRFHKRAGQPEGSSTSRTTTARRRR